jgi:hypothetical protein
MDLSQTPVSALTAACRRETDRFRRGEPSCDEYCFELFRRAVCDQDESAWAVVVAQYRGIVQAWVQRQGWGSDDADYWVNRTFDRFWTAVRPERFGQFESLSRVLKYLQMCAATAVLDERRSQRATPHESLEEVIEGHPETERAPAGHSGDVESGVLDRLTGKELWAAIVREVVDEDERTVLYCSYALDMKPAEIGARRRDLFPTVADVYRVKRNVLERLRRSPAMRQFVEAVPEKSADRRLLE